MSPSSEEGRLALDYLALRNLVGMLGVALPIILLFGGWLLFRLPQQPTISDYHDGEMRDAFVGLLCALGVFLLAYRGYEWKDRYASRLAGLAAIAVAVFPHAPPGQPDPAAAGLDSLYLPGAIHFAAAFVFFVTVALISMRLFTKSSKPRAQQSLAKRRRNAVYRACGWGILACIALIGAYTFWLHAWLPEGTVFWLETAAVWLFGISWTVKGKAKQWVVTTLRGMAARGRPAA